MKRYFSSEASDTEFCVNLKWHILTLFYLIIVGASQLDRNIWLKLAEMWVTCDSNSIGMFFRYKISDCIVSAFRTRWHSIFCSWVWFFVLGCKRPVLRQKKIIRPEDLLPRFNDYRCWLVVSDDRLLPEAHHRRHRSLLARDCAFRLQSSSLLPKESQNRS